MPVSDAHDLYGLPLERFVTERAALAKSIRLKGEPERAAHVAKLRKPSVAAWAVNQLVRTQRSAVKELFAAGEQLERAQGDLVAGRADAEKLRRASERERAALTRLAGAARGLLSSEGHELSETILDRVRETLNAAALDGEARAAVADGCLERELRHVGLGVSSASSPSTKRRSAERGADRKRTERLAARKAAENARRAAERAAGELRVAQQRRDRADAELEEAESKLAAARKTAEQATSAWRARGGTRN